MSSYALTYPMPHVPYICRSRRKKCAVASATGQRPRARGDKQPHLLALEDALGVEEAVLPAEEGGEAPGRPYSSQELDVPPAAARRPAGWCAMGGERWNVPGMSVSGSGGLPDAWHEPLGHGARSLGQDIEHLQHARLPASQPTIAASTAQTTIRENAVRARCGGDQRADLLPDMRRSVRTMPGESVWTPTCRDTAPRG
jgi:hypothetical protein